MKDRMKIKTVTWVIRKLTGSEENLHIGILQI